MADTMQFDLVSPERKLVSVQASEVQIPAAEGAMSAMPGHAATITTLRPGVLRVVTAEGTQEFVVTGGFAQITGDATSVLAEQALPRDEVTPEALAEMVAEAERRVNEAKSDFENEPGPVDDAAKLLSDMVAMGEEIGLNK